MVTKQLKKTNQCWEAYVTGSKLDNNGSNIIRHIENIVKAPICQGNPDTRFSTLDITKASCVRENGSVRSVSCVRLIDNVNAARCEPCAKTREYLRGAASSAIQKKQVNPVVDRLQTELSKASNENLRLRSLLEATEKEKVAVEAQLDNVIRSAGEESLKSLKSGTLAHMFIKQQLQYREVGGHAMRWHPTMIRWALTVQAKSSSTYNLMRDSGMVCLPSDRTLSDFKHCRPLEAGVDHYAIQQTAKTHPNADFTLMLDEMKIKNGLVYNRNTGKLSGYVGMGDLSTISQDDFKADVASHACVFLARSIRDKRVSFVPATFFTKTASSTELFYMLWEVIAAMELMGLRVRIVVSDGASSNRLLAKCHQAQNSTDEIVYRTPNRYASRWLYFASDAPHLVKTTRNCVEMSGGHLNTRNIIVSHTMCSIDFYFSSFMDHRFTTYLYFQFCKKSTQNVLDRSKTPRRSSHTN